MPWQTQSVMNQRIEFAMKSLQTDNFRALCREYGISAKVGYKWRGRFVAEGISGLRDLSRRPKHSTVRSCFERLFADYGVPAAIRSDNGSLLAVMGG